MSKSGQSSDRDGTVRGSTEELERLKLLYPVLAARAQTAGSQTWSMPGLAIATQSFLIAAALARPHGLPVQIGLSVAIVAVGLGTLTLMFKLDQSANVDRLLLDRYEADFLGIEDHPRRLRHRLSLDTRDAEVRAAVGEPSVRHDLPRIRLMMRLTHGWRPALIWLAIELVVSVVGAAAPWLA